MKIAVEFTSTMREVIECSPADTVLTLKERAFHRHFSDTDIHDLTYLGKRLNDDCLLGDCIVTDNPVLYLVFKVRFPGG